MSLEDRYWTLVGSKLGVINTEDIEIERRYPTEGGSGGFVLTRWKQHPSKTYQDLIEALREVGLNQAADEIVQFLGNN